MDAASSFLKNLFYYVISKMMIFFVFASSFLVIYK